MILFLSAIISTRFRWRNVRDELVVLAFRAGADASSEFVGKAAASISGNKRGSDRTSKKAHKTVHRTSLLAGSSFHDVSLIRAFRGRDCRGDAYGYGNRHRSAVCGRAQAIKADHLIGRGRRHVHMQAAPAHDVPGNLPKEQIIAATGKDVCIGCRPVGQLDASRGARVDAQASAPAWNTDIEASRRGERTGKSQGGDIRSRVDGDIRDRDDRDGIAASAHVVPPAEQGLRAGRHAGDGPPCQGGGI